MATPKCGRGATGGFGIESTWGTAVSRTNWLLSTGQGQIRQLDLQPRNHFGRVSAVSANRRASPHLVADYVGGTFEWEFAYDDSSILLLGAAMGASSCSTAGGPTYTHTHTLKEALHLGLTYEQIDGNGTAEVVEGLLIDRFTLAIAAGGVARARIDWIGQTSGGRASAGTPTYSSNGEVVLHHQGSNLTWDTLDSDIISMELVINNNLARQLRVGSSLTRKPVRGGFQEVTMRVVRDWDADLEHVDYLARTQADAAITFTGATSPNAMAITLHNAMLRSNPLPGVQGPGPIEQTLDLVGYSDGTDEGLKVIITNGNSAGTTN